MPRHKAQLAACKTLANQSKSKKRFRAGSNCLYSALKKQPWSTCELSNALWKHPWMLRTALAGSRASKQIEKSLVFKALAAAAAQALVVAAAWRAIK